MQHSALVAAAGRLASEWRRHLPIAFGLQMELQWASKSFASSDRRRGRRLIWNGKWNGSARFLRGRAREIPLAGVCRRGAGLLGSSGPLALVSRKLLGNSTQLCHTDQLETRLGSDSSRNVHRARKRRIQLTSQVPSVSSANTVGSRSTLVDCCWPLSCRRTAATCWSIRLCVCVARSGRRGSSCATQTN